MFLVICIPFSPCLRPVALRNEPVQLIGWRLTIQQGGRKRPSGDRPRARGGHSGEDRGTVGAARSPMTPEIGPFACLLLQAKELHATIAEVFRTSRQQAGNGTGENQ